MNVVFISPHFPDNFYNFCVSLNNQGVRVFAIADFPYDALRPELKQALTEYYQVADMADYDQLYKACDYFCNKYGRIDRIESHNEFWLETDARLRSDFNVFGIKISQIQDMKLKSQMKKKYIEAQVPVAPGIIARDYEESRKFLEEHGYPFVAKPDNGVGAANTYKVKNDRDLKNLFETMGNIEYFLEKFVDGVIYSYDGLVDKDGKVVFAAAHVFETGIMEVVNYDLDLFYYSLIDIPDKLAEYGRNTLKIFDIRERFFHLEFFKSETGEYKALEVNMRPPGGLTLDMFNYANDISVYDGWAEVLTVNRFSEACSREYHTCYFGRKINKNYVNYHEDILRKFGHLLVYHSQMNPIFRTVMGNYGYVCRSQKLEDLRNVAEYAQVLRQ